MLLQDDVMRGCLMNFAARAGRTELGEQLFAQGLPGEAQANSTI